MSLIPDADVRVGPYTIADVVNGSLIVPIEDADGDVVDLDGYTVQSAAAISPAGADELVGADVVELVDGTHVLEFTFTALTFDEPGLWRLLAVLVTPSGSILETESLRFAVEDRDNGWLTLAGVRGLWRDAPRNDVALFRLLDVARLQVTAYAPAPLPAIIPDNYVAAQRDQVQNIWSKSKADPSNFGIGEGDLVIRPYPMDPAIKDMIRPKPAKPVVR